jgi:lysophospholipase L1-like esterase
MQGKLKKIKDNSEQYIFPVSVSEAVFVEETKNLKTKLSEIDQAISNGGGSTAQPYIANKKINVIGDSIVRGTTDGATPWTTFLSDNNNCVVRNHGVNGARLADDGTTYSVYSRYQSMEDDADIVIVWAGWNDINKPVPLGTFDSRDGTTYYGALHLIAEGLLTKYIGKKIFFCTLLNTHASWTTVKSFNNAIREVTEYWGLQVIETSKVGFNGRNATVKSSLIPDNVHPNTEGNKIIADVMAKFINSH